MDAVRYVDLRCAGWSAAQIERAVEASTAHRVARGALLIGSGAPTRLEWLAALFKVLPPHAVIGFHTAAALHGFGVVTDPRPHVVVPAGLPRPDIRGVAVHEAVVPIGQPVLIGGLPCVPAARAAIDLARTCRRMDAIAVLDAALRSGPCTPESLRDELRSHDGLRGVRQARELLLLADARAECRQESQLRLVLVDGRLARPEPQLWVSDEHGRRVYRLDLGYGELRVGAEYDGVSHLDRSRMRHDRQRHNWLATRGWTIRYFTDIDLYRRQPYIVATMRQALKIASI